MVQLCGGFQRRRAAAKREALARCDPQHRSRHCDAAVARSNRPGHQGRDAGAGILPPEARSEEHTSELQSLMRISYAVFCLKKKKTYKNKHTLSRVLRIVQYESEIDTYNGTL